VILKAAPLAVSQPGRVRGAAWRRSVSGADTGIMRLPRKAVLINKSKCLCQAPVCLTLQAMKNFQNLQDRVSVTLYLVSKNFFN
jgi:hypothetical protein